MKYVQPIGAAAGAAYVDAAPASGIEGSAVPAAAIEHPQREIEAVIIGAGFVPATGDLTQLRQAIVKMIQSGQRAVIISNATFAAAVTGTGKAVYWDAGNSRFDLALADGTAKQSCVGFADVANGNVYAFGDAVLFTGLTPGARYYLDGATAGAITATAPTNAVFVGIARNATELFVDVDAGSGAGVPVGTVIHVARNSAPTGYLKANGALLSRTTYSELFGAIGTTYGAGDGATTFALPDLRGEFVRGWDDGRGVDSGRVFGSAQSDDFKSHSHQQTTNNTDYGSGVYGANTSGNAASGSVASGNYTLSAGGSETRPRNVALLACIKY
ncbi:tail fiber protein [Rhodocyclus tenuis]|uniref:Microcystin-dependent protein n=1 Tax=Rhodocyclus tenuis TaxID=1066 RepID=A0A840G786_RHOTE|nr:tail fiber protein [Rhodocyclus tenuis]MBB4246568.1 microcystin-dependent protein [Rhodocyclus tenuis]